MLNLLLKKKYFDAIKLGTKTVEGRLDGEKFKDLKPGMKISFTTIATNEVIWCVIEAIARYQNFADMLHAEGVENMLPGVISLTDGVAIYEGFPGYAQEVTKRGAVAIRIKVFSNN